LKFGGNCWFIALRFERGEFTFEAVKVPDTRAIMKTWIAILLTFGIIASCGLFTWLTGDKNAGNQIFALVLVGTSVWVGVDSAMLRLGRYQSGISYRPVTLGILCSMSWIVAFPWYLSMRYKIRSGTARLRPEFARWDMGSGQMSPRGLVQPWQGKRI
jgi:hypothetical protein